MTDKIRARLAEVEAERDRAEERWAEWFHRGTKAEAKLAEVEAERDELTAGYAAQIETISDLLRRVRAVEAVCNEASGDHIGGVTVVRVPLVRAAARGEGDRG